VKLLSFIGHESLADGLFDLHTNLIKDLADRMSPMWVPMRSNWFHLLFIRFFVRCFLMRVIFAIVIAHYEFDALILMAASAGDLL
jgi:hypothetical protein